jgi:hypothetical protein
MVKGAAAGDGRATVNDVAERLCRDVAALGDQRDDLLAAIEGIAAGARAITNTEAAKASRAGRRR